MLLNGAIEEEGIRYTLSNNKLGYTNLISKWIKKYCNYFKILIKGDDNLNIQIYQSVVELNIVNWENIGSLSEKIDEVRESQRHYLNDLVEIQQIVDFGRVTDESHKIIIIFNTKRDLDNLGEKISL